MAKKVLLPPYLLSIDIGTEGCKVAIFNNRGETLTKSYQQYPLIVPKPLWVEQNPYLWLNAIKKAISNVMEDINPEEVACIGLSGQSPVLVPVDVHGKPLMNAILWMDRRAVRQSKVVTEITGVKEDPSLLLPKIIWIKENFPEVFRRTHKFLQATDFIAYNLTGKFATDWLSASTYHYDIERGENPEKILNALEIPPEKFPEAFKPGTIVGTLLDKASQEVGLREGIPVVIGGIDAYMAVIGVGALKNGIACEITGSSTCLMVASSQKIHDPQERIHCQVFPLIPDLWIVYGIMSTTGASLRWFRDNLSRQHENYKDLDVEAEKIPAGSNGLIFLPYMMGERSPIWDPFARGTLIGLSLNHSRGHIIRAILEGCSFALRHNLEIIEENGVSVREIRSCGGAAKSRIFGQIKADVTGKTIFVPKEIDATLLGTAIISAVSVGIYERIEEAAENMVHIKERIVPQENIHSEYNLFFQMYKEAYEHLKEYFRRYYSSL